MQRNIYSLWKVVALVRRKKKIKFQGKKIYIYKAKNIDYSKEPFYRSFAGHIWGEM